MSPFASTTSLQNFCLSSLHSPLAIAAVGQCLSHQPNHLLQPVIGAQDLPAGFSSLDQPLLVTVGEYRQIGDHLAYAGEFVISHGAVYGGTGATIT